MKQEELKSQFRKDSSQNADCLDSTESLDFRNIVQFYFFSPIGFLQIARLGDCIIESSFDDVPRPKYFTIPTDPVLGMAFDALTRYFTGEIVDFSELSISLDGSTEFQHAVWNTVRQIPYGEVRTYKWIANQIGRPNAARSIGNTVAGNLLNIIIPCHRVIGSNGRLSGYNSGVWRKCQLLELEGYPVEKLKIEREWYW